MSEPESASTFCTRMTAPLFFTSDGSTMNQTDHFFFRAIKALRTLVALPARRRQHGFSLIELLIVMIILGLIASLVGPRLFGKLGTAKQKTAKTQIEMLMAALDGYRLDLGRYPSEQEGLAALMQNPGNEKWEGPYLKKDLPGDPWGNPYRYQNPGQHGEIDIFSYGADGKPGGDKEDADVGSWQ